MALRTDPEDDCRAVVINDILSTLVRSLEQRGCEVSGDCSGTLKGVRDLRVLGHVVPQLALYKIEQSMQTIDLESAADEISSTFRKVETPVVSLTRSGEHVTIMYSPLE